MLKDIKRLRKETILNMIAKDMFLNIVWFMKIFTNVVYLIGLIFII